MSQKLSTPEYKLLCEVIDSRIEGLQVNASMLANTRKDTEAADSLRKITDLRRIQAKLDPNEVDL